jgi:Spy/CpxP family protein refolding chaperone
MKRTLRITTVALTLLATPAVLVSQERHQEEPDFGRFLYPPELIMQFQQKIGLRPEQRTTITQAIQQLQSKVVELQWQMQAEAQKLTEIMQNPSIKEADALAQVDRVLSIEREVKRTHLGTLIRIKNTLDRDQQAALDSLQGMWQEKAPTSSNVTKRSGTATKSSETKTKSSGTTTKRPLD